MRKNLFYLLSLAAAIGIASYHPAGNVKQKIKAVQSAQESEILIEPDSLEQIIKKEDIKVVPKINSVHILSKIGDNQATSYSKITNKSEKVKLCLLLDVNIDGKRKYISDLKTAKLDKRKINNIEKWDTEKMGPISILWYKVEPERVFLTNWLNWEDPKNRKYKLARIPYIEKLFEKDSWCQDAEVDSDKNQMTRGNGTMRFKVAVKYFDQTVASAGAESTGESGIKDNVHRIIVKGNTGNEFIDNALAYVNVPYIFGNTEYQADNFLGVDCADFAIAPLRLMGYNVKYTNALGLLPGAGGKLTQMVAREPTLDENGNYCIDGRPIKYGDKGVKSGDLVVFHKGAIPHAGILAIDMPPLNQFGKNDIIFHTLGRPVAVPISSAYNKIFNIVRFRDNKISKL